MIRPDSIQAMIDPTAMARRLNSPLHLSLVVTVAVAISAGMPTLTNQGTRYAVENPVTRVTLSLQVVKSLPSPRAQMPGDAVHVREVASDHDRDRPGKPQ